MNTAPNRLGFRDSFLFTVVLLLPFIVAACGKDTEVAKREFVQSGDAFMAEKKYPEALIQYRNAVQQDPMFAEARQKLADAYGLSGDLVNAGREAIRAADLLPNDARAQVKAGEMLLVWRQFEDAQNRADKALAIEPKSVDALILRANALAGLTKLDEAIAAVEEAIQNDPERASNYASLGAMKIAGGHRAEAEAAFRKAVETDPKSMHSRLALANYYWTTAQPSAAEEQLRAALTIEPNNVLANRMLALFYIGTGRGKEAEPYFKTIASVVPGATGKLTLADYYAAIQRPNEARRILEEVAAGNTAGAVGAKLRLASMGLRANDAAGATRLVDEVLSAEPRNVDGLLAKAQLLAGAGKTQEALGAVEAALQVNPQSARVQFALGRIQEIRGEHAPAIAAFTEALRLNPRMGAADLELAKLYLSTGQVEQAERFARSALVKMGNFAEAHLVLSRILIQQGKLAQAEPTLRALARQFPNDPQVQVEVGQLELSKGNRAAARSAFTRVVQRDALHPGAQRGLLTIDLQEKRGAAAVTRLQAAVKEAPARGALLVLLGRAHGATGDVNGAERVLRQAVEVDPRDMEAYGLLAQLYLTQRRLPEAIDHFTKLAAQRPQVAVGAQTMVGTLLTMQGKLAEARTKFEQVMALDQYAAVAANNLSWLYAEQGTNLDMALQLAKTAKAQLPDQPEVDDTLGWVYYKKGQGTMAIPAFLESIQGDPKNPVYHYHLGLAYAATGQNAQARAAYEKSLALDGTSPASAQVKQALAALKG